MIKHISAALLTVLVCTLVVLATPSAVIAASTPVQASFDIAVPAQQVPLDETVSASLAE